MTVSLETSSRFVAFIAIFTALAAVLDSIPIIPGFYGGVWDSWLFLMSPLFGIILGPIGGAVSIAMGSFIGHLVYFRDPYELLFMWGAPLGAGISGLVFQRRWKPVFIIYTGLLLAYLVTPVSWQLPLWGIWDVLVGFGVLVLFSVIVNTRLWPESGDRRNVIGLLFATVIGLESDVLLRVFFLVPCQTYWFFYGLTVEGLQILWWGAGFVTPLKVLMAVVVGLTIGFSLIRIIPNQNIVEN
jgi:hypothetical protein